jgi:hypothetical protein
MRVKTRTGKIKYHNYLVVLVKLVDIALLPHMQKCHFGYIFVGSYGYSNVSVACVTRREANTIGRKAKWRDPAGCS